MSDHFTSTVDGAAAYERGRAADSYSPEPEMTRAEAEREQAESYFDLHQAQPYRPAPLRRLSDGRSVA